MGERATQSLLRELTRGLEPVRPLPRLRRLVGLVLAVFAAVMGLHALAGGPMPLRVSGVPWGDGAFLSLMVGLVLTAGGAIVAALAGAVPGREEAARTGRAVALAGVSIAAGAGLWGIARAPHAAPLELDSSLHCFGRAGALGVLPAIVVCLLLVRAFECRPLLGAMSASVGALSLGAIVVHASCPNSGAFHVLLGHWASPFAAALVLALPLSVAVARFSASSGARAR